MFESFLFLDNDLLDSTLKTDIISAARRKFCHSDTPLQFKFMIMRVDFSKHMGPLVDCFRKTQKNYLEYQRYSTI